MQHAIYKVRNFLLVGTLATIHLFGPVLGGPKPAVALPFNQDMVGKQMITGSVMRQKEAGTISAHSLPRQLPERSVIVETWTNPFAKNAEELASAAERGKRSFQVQCVVCHGSIQAGQHVPSDLMQKGIPSINLLLSQEKFIPQRTDGFLWAYIFSGIDAIMPRYGYKLSNEQIWELVSYIRKLQADNPM